MPDTTGVFISYRQSDSKAWAAFLRDELGDHFGHDRIFLDRDSLTAGSWREQIEHSLGQCRVTLVVIGPNWSQAAAADGKRRLDDPADVHRLEIEAALKRSGMTVIPVLVDNASLPNASLLPGDLRGLLECQARFFSDTKAHRDADLKVLVADIAQASGLADVAPAAAAVAEAARVRYLPFKLDVTAARTAFEKWTRELSFAPGDFASAAKLETFAPTWVPHWVAEVTVSAHWRGRKGVKRTVLTEGRDASGKPTSQSSEVTEWTDVSGDLYRTLEPLIRLATRDLDESAPTLLRADDLKALRTEDMLPDPAVQRAAVQIERDAAHDWAADESTKRARELARGEIGGQEQELVDVNVRHERLDLKSVLAPAFVGRFSYRGKSYPVTVNASTGDTHGARPLSKGKVGVIVAAGIVLALAIAWFVFAH